MRARGGGREGGGVQEEVSIEQNTGRARKKERQRERERETERERERESRASERGRPKQRHNSWTQIGSVHHSTHYGRPQTIGRVSFFPGSGRSNRAARRYCAR